MPFDHLELNDGSKIPSIAYGSSDIPLDQTPTQIDQAINLGFEHIDTAQSYRNETETGRGIKETGLSRKEIWVTTKWSGVDDKQPIQSCGESLEKLGLEYVDLYLIHAPRHCKGDIPKAWRAMEELYKMGRAKCIGVSNFSIADLQQVLDCCSIKPVVNQILLHPDVYHDTTSLLDFMAKHNIVAEAYSPLRPLREDRPGPVVKVVEQIAAKKNANPEQVLLAWIKTKGAVAITKSSRKDRLEGMLAAGDLHLSHHDIDAIERAGRQSAIMNKMKARAMGAGKWITVACLAGYISYRIITLV